MFYVVTVKNYVSYCLWYFICVFTLWYFTLCYISYIFLFFVVLFKRKCRPLIKIIKVKLITINQEIMDLGGVSNIGGALHCSNTFSKAQNNSLQKHFQDLVVIIKKGENVIAKASQA